MKKKINKQLIRYRQELDRLFSQWDLWRRTRQRWIKKIIQHKKREGLSSYDPQREELFFKKHQRRWSFYTQEELLAFSLIMEGQARSLDSSYPAWSKKEHLRSSSQKNNLHDLTEMMNPLLVKYAFPEKFLALPLTNVLKNLFFC